MGNCKVSKRLWARFYRWRMDSGLEECRLCESRESLTFGHILPSHSGGRFSCDNMTILCYECNQAMGGSYIMGLLSLADELDSDPDLWREMKEWGRENVSERGNPIRSEALDRILELLKLQERDGGSTAI